MISWLTPKLLGGKWSYLAIWWENVKTVKATAVGTVLSKDRERRAQTLYAAQTKDEARTDRRKRRRSEALRMTRGIPNRKPISMAFPVGGELQASDERRYTLYPPSPVSQWISAEL